MIIRPILFVVLVASTVVTSCGTATPTQAADIFAFPTAIGLTPANLDVVIGTPRPAVPLNNNWQSYQSNQLGISLNYPPDWKAITLSDASGVGLYPPESDPDFPTPMIRIEWLNVPYSAHQPLLKTESQINPIEVSGVTGSQYQDSKFALPAQSYYIELPHQDGTLFIVTTEGPSVDLRSQLVEILKTLNLSSGTALASETPANSPAIPSETPNASLPAGPYKASIIIESALHGKAPLNVILQANLQSADGGSYLCNYSDVNNGCRYTWRVYKSDSSGNFGDQIDTRDGPWFTSSFDLGNYFITVEVCLNSNNNSCGSDEVYVSATKK